MAVPAWNGTAYELRRLVPGGQGTLRSGPAGVLEPVGTQAVDPRAVTRWLVPGLAFTPSGGRIGYGGGWYDRLLDAASEGAEKWGIAYDFQIFDDLPEEKHDLRLDGVKFFKIPPCQRARERV